uniref:Uncharacterized protein n=1 Tax=Oryza meridionalis TaxID=40149 RepID=A0A0E0FDA1_9ORYZ
MSVRSFFLLPFSPPPLSLPSGPAPPQAGASSAVCAVGGWQCEGHAPAQPAACGVGKKRLQLGFGGGGVTGRKKTASSWVSTRTGMQSLLDVILCRQQFCILGG